jgi:hypothetical protein
MGKHMNVPVRFAFQITASQKLLLTWLWRITDVTFKVVAWCLAVGVVKYAFEQSHDWRLALLAELLQGLVYVAVLITTYQTITSLRIYVPGGVSPLARFLPAVAGGLAGGLAMYAALNVIESAIAVLSSLHGVAP